MPSGWLSALYSGETVPQWFHSGLAEHNRIQGHFRTPNWLTFYARTGNSLANEIVGAASRRVRKETRSIAAPLDAGFRAPVPSQGTSP